MVCTLNISTINKRGLVNQKARKQFFTLCQEQNLDIICIQETHCTAINVDKIAQDWAGVSVFGLTDSPHSRGVGILFRKGIDITINECHKSCDGRMVFIRFTYKNETFSLFNMYAPNHEKNRILFFKKVKNWINRHCVDCNDVILCGDMNCCYRDEDRSTKTHLNDLSREEFDSIVKLFKLVDVWHHLKPSKCGYTWENSNGSVKSRLDYFLVSSTIIPNIKTVKSMYVPNTDHKQLYISINIKGQTAGPGYWKLNSSLLEHQGYIDGIHTIISNVLRECTDIKSKRITWEILKVKIKEFSIQFSVSLSKRKKDILHSLQNEFDILSSIDQTNMSTLQTVKFASIKRKIKEYSDEKQRGAFIRSKATWLEKGEQSTKFFLSLEKKRQTHNVIRELHNQHDKKVTLDRDILESICIFYEKLYKSRNPNQDQINQYLNTTTLPFSLSQEQKEVCDKDICISEFDTVVKKLKVDKSPGDDGLTSNFYMAFWAQLRNIYFDMIAECVKKGELCISMKRAIVAILYKKGDTWLLKNYRPISLNNYDYKILAFVFSERLQKVISNIIHSDQTAYIRNRFIGNSARCIIDVIEYCKKFNEDGILMCLDFEKAFDSLEWNFLFKTLKKFNFGDKFINWMKLLYNKPVMMFKNNGFISRKIYPTRGVRQGCPVSALLFIIAVEILAVKLRNSRDIKGIAIRRTKKCIKLKQYADDTTLVLRNFESITCALKCIKEFGEVSGLKLNKAKTEGILLGSLADQNHPNMEIKFTSDPVRCLGIFIGCNKSECDLKNWTDKIQFFEQTLDRWKQRNLTLFGRILILKILGLSKFVYLFSVLYVPEDIRKTLKTIMYKFLWNGRESVKRKTMSCAYEQGGLKMIDLDVFIMSLNAAYAARLITNEGCENIFIEFYAAELGCSLQQLFHCYITKSKYDKNISDVFPEFYQNVIYAYNECRFFKKATLMNPYDFLSQTIWHNEFLMWKSNALDFKNWIDAGIVFVCDLFHDNGTFLSGEDVYRKLRVKTNWIAQYTTVKKVIVPKLVESGIDSSYARHINTNNIKVDMLNTEKGLIPLCGKKSKFFYDIIIRKHVETPTAQCYWERSLNVQKSKWKDIYINKIVLIKDKKIAEFNFKLLHRILPCRYYLHKWNPRITETCPFCGQIESIEHLVFFCNRIQAIWNVVGNALNCKIRIKHILFGFPYADIAVVEYCISIIAYFIYKTWLLFNLEYNDDGYKNCNLMAKIKNELTWKIEILKQTKYKDVIKSLSKIYEKL